MKKLSEAKAAANARWRERNRAAIRAQQAGWRAANPERIRENNLRRIGWSAALFDIACGLQSGLCAICRTDLTVLPPTTTTPLARRAVCCATTAMRGWDRSATAPKRSRERSPTSPRRRSRRST